MSQFSDNLIFVLVRPRNAGNVGSAARALGNMGFHHLRTAQAWNLEHEEAQKLAVDAASLIRPEMEYSTLKEAIADAQIVYGTVARPRTGWVLHDIREYAAQIRAQAETNKIAILFGSERNGLSAAEADECNALLTIPTGEYASLNLAQAVLLVAYELFNSGHPATGELPALSAPRREQDRALEGLLNLLETVDFMKPARRQEMLRLLRQFIGHRGLSSKDVQILLGIIRQIDWKLSEKFSREGDDTT